MQNDSNAIIGNRYVCRLADLAEGQARGFTVPTDGAVRDVLLVRKNGVVFGYVNSCPHTGVALDWLPDQFLDLEERHIQCATHGALFRIEDGLCLAGPCAGDSLTTLPLVVEDGWIRWSAD